MYSKIVCAVAFACLCGIACAGVPYSSPSYAETVKLPETGEASASALTNVASARAAAAKINAVNLNALDKFGLETGVPLLTKPYGPLTNLYAASLPARSLVGELQQGFYKDHYGQVKYHTGSSIGLLVL